MNQYTRMMVFAFVGVVCAVLLAYAQDDKKKPFDSPEEELAELASEHKDVKKECKDMKKELEKQKKTNGTECPNLKKKYELCEDFKKTIQKAMKDLSDKIEKEDKDDDDDSDSDDDDD